jgi:pyruvate dehydrogenase E2 component (dihydrolipoamide acetyltransferase)
MGVFTMPSLGADMDAGTLVEWLVKPGDRVSPGDIVAVVETQKGAIEIEIFEAGVIDRLEAEVGDRLPVGAPLARLTAPGEAPSQPTQPTQPPAEPPPREVPAAPPLRPPAAAPPAPPPSPAQPPQAPAPAVAATGAMRQGPPASPGARRRAAELGIDLAGVHGTGPGGAVLLADVEAAVAAPRRREVPVQEEAPVQPHPPMHKAGKSGLDLEAMRAAIAAAMARSKREIPHYYLSHTIDLQPATDWLAATNAERPPERRLLMGALLVKATALAAQAVPGMNGQNDGAFRPSEAVHAGVAVALRGGGLIAPAIRDAQALALDDLMAAMRDLVARARTGRLRSSEMTDGTITVSSMGETGAEALFGVIYPPQVALVGFGAPVRRPWVVGEALEARTVVTASLAADHRVSDGRRGARFLAEIERLLQAPEGL